MRIAFEIQSSQYRRLQSLLKQQSRCVIMCTDSVNILVSGDVDFKNLTIPGKVPSETFFSMDSDILLCSILGQGVILMDIEDTTIRIFFAKTWEDLKINRILALSEGQIKPQIKRDVIDFLDLIRASKMNELQFNGISRLSTMVKSCIISENPLEIAGGYALTQNDNMIIYSKVTDPNLRAGFTVNALKELDKFKLQGSAVEVDSYILMNRDDLTIGVRKAVIRCNIDEDVPTEFREDSLGLICGSIDLKPFISVARSISSDSIKLYSGNVRAKICLETGEVEIELFNKKIMLSVATVIKKSNISLSNKHLYLNYSDLEKISTLISSKEKDFKLTDFCIYNDACRLTLTDDTSVLIGSDFE